METTLLQLAASLGGFAGLTAGVMMLFVLRAQSSQQGVLNKLISSLMEEMIVGRQASNTVIEANTRAMTMVHATVAEMCAQLGAHDDHARDIGTVITRMEGEIGQVVRKLPVRQHTEGDK